MDQFTYGLGGGRAGVCGKVSKTLGGGEGRVKPAGFVSHGKEGISSMGRRVGQGFGFRDTPERGS